MVFNSIEFLIFFLVVLVLYYTIPVVKYRNGMLLIASYYFYMNWEPIYAILLFITTISTFFTGISLSKNSISIKHKKFVVAISILVNLGILFFFKYLNFINQSIFNLFNTCDIRWTVPQLDILLPVGISFYTFQAVGYVVDVYRNTDAVERDFINYSLFVSFFPFILSGPIQRSEILLPQLNEKKHLQYYCFIIGLQMILWGFFMKLCVADRLATYVNAVYSNLYSHNGTSFLIASIFYTIQIYCDFAGYSLIALGCAKMLGFSLPDNFKRPYFSASIKEFWKRWHISLTSWFGNYLYIPLGGNRVKISRFVLNIMIVFLVSGLWHGAAWTFIIWGGLHGVLYLIEFFYKKHIVYSNYSNKMLNVFRIIIVFFVVNIAWIFFKAPTLDEALYIVENIFYNQGKPFISAMSMVLGIIGASIVLVKDYLEEKGHCIYHITNGSLVLPIISIVLLIEYILLFGVLDNSQYIYFQF